MNPPDLFPRLLHLLRQYGWETGPQQLAAEIQAASEDERRVLLEHVRAWFAAERGEHDDALRGLRENEQVPLLAAWAVYGQAFVALRRKELRQAHDLLDRAVRLADPTDSPLLARLALARGTAFLHQGKPDLALPLLHHALEYAGPDTFTTGRVLDAMGMVYAGKDNFHAAREFYGRALRLKERFGDEPGQALTHGQLARLYLDWGHLDRAEYHFNEDLRIARRIGDVHGEVQLYNHLGQVALARGDWPTAADWLDEAIRRSHEGGRKVMEGFARKDRALAHLGSRDLAAAEAEVERADALFREADFAEGRAHAARVRGSILRILGRHADAGQALRTALAHFERSQERVEVARTQLELARTQRTEGCPRPLVVKALVEGLRSAETSRRAALVSEIGAELRAVDEAAWWRHAYRRLRGGFPEESDSLLDGTSEPVAVLFFDLKGSTDYGRTNDPQVVMMTLNQMMAELEPVLERHEARVTAYLGDGFMAVLRGVDHALRAVEAALGMLAALREFNRPRRVLKLEPFAARVGIATGPVFLGNLGTYHKMDYTAVGNTVNLAARLQGEAEAGAACIDRATQELIRGRFPFDCEGMSCRLTGPRTAALKGIGECPVWDVIPSE
jgi:class 3 adenylate cyclase